MSDQLRREARVHEYIDPSGSSPNTTLEVDKLATEVKAAIRDWFDDLQKPKNQVRLANVARHLPWLAREKPKILPSGLLPSGGTTVSSTSTSS
jgi:hypothetical protein